MRSRDQEGYEAMTTDDALSRYRLMDTLVTDDGLQVNFEIQTADGATATHLALEQARVLREVVAWVAQKRSGHGQDLAA